MYSLEKYDYITSEPWKIMFTSRIKRLVKAQSLGSKIVVYIYEKADTSTFRYRAYNMCQALQTSNEWSGQYFFKDELEYLKSYLYLVNIVVIIRYRWDIELEDFISEARKNNIKIACDVDDLVYDSKYVSLITNTLAVEMSSQEDYDYWFSYTGRIEATAYKSDLFLSTNDYIGDVLKKDFKKDCYIMKNFFNRLQMSASQYYCSQKSNYKNRKNKFCIGYFSGTPSHINDFMVVAPELSDLLHDFDDIKLKIVGFMTLPSYMNEFVENGKIELVPLKNFIDLQKEIAEVDVNIIPLQNNTFCNCKSELKFFEAGIVETISCATPTYVYQKLIKHGENGFLCRQGEWYEVISSLYLNGIDQNIVNEARRISYDQYLFRGLTNNLELVLDLILNSST